MPSAIPAGIPPVYPTVVHMLVDAAQASPDNEALVSGEERLDYREYLRCVVGFALELQGRGLCGRRVALLMGNSIDICIAMFAVHAAGAEVVPLNPMYTARELAPMLVDANATAILYDESLDSVIRSVTLELPVEHLIPIGTKAGRRLTERPVLSRQQSLDDLPKPEDPATLQFTGGTTGRAKGVRISHRALSVNISQREAVFSTLEGVERMLCVMPLFHCYAVAMCLHAMVYRRGTLVILPRYHPADVTSSIDREKITLFGGSPTIFTSLLNYPGFAETDFSNLRLCSSGSAPLAGDVLEAWETTTGTPILEGYGQSEAGPVISFNPVGGARKPMSVGIALPGTEIQVVDLKAGTSVLEPGRKGEIRIAGPQIMDGYLNLPAETGQALRDGWLYTGDIGELDEDGYLFIRGRKKEMLIVSGYNVFPREIEEVLHGNPVVTEAAVVGKPDDYRGELPVAFVVLGQTGEPNADALISYCAERMAPYKIPAEFHFVESLPKTAVGKVDKVLLRQTGS